MEAYEEELVALYLVIIEQKKATDARHLQTVAELKTKATKIYSNAEVKKAYPNDDPTDW